MTTLGQLVANSLWFAFDALDQQKSGAVPKSQLKVLTQNVGVILNINRRVEECIIDYMSHGQLTFEQFLYFLTHEVFAEVDDGLKSYSRLKVYHDALDRAFWVLGRPGLLTRHQPILSETALFKIFRIFCLLGDRSSETGSLTQVTLSKGEVDDVTRSLVIELGREWDPQDFKQVASMIPAFTLPVFLTLLEGGRYLQDIEPPALEAAVEEIYQTFVEQVLDKGKMYQRLSWAPIWIWRDIEVVPWEIRPVKHSSPLNPLRQSIRIKVSKPNPVLQPIQNRLTQSSLFQPIQSKLNQFNSLSSLTPRCSVHSIHDEPGAKPCRITVCCDDDKLLQLAAPDHRTKTRWIRALEEAIENSSEPLPYQMVMSTGRKEDRALEEERQSAERMRRASQADIIEQTQAELVAERQARAEAEATAREEAAARATEVKRVQELTTLRKELEQLLEQETQAKRDEEIVRNLQARVLREEWEKREELERLQQEQNLLLEEEKKKREAFELIQEEKEVQLKEAQKMLRKLEVERMKLDHELRSTREKIVMSERGKELLEARMKVKERTPPVRTYSLRPTRREQQQRTAPLRSSSFNTHTNNKVVKRRDKSSTLPKQREEYPSSSEEVLKSSDDSLDITTYHAKNSKSNITTYGTVTEASVECVIVRSDLRTRNDFSVPDVLEDVPTENKTEDRTEVQEGEEIVGQMEFTRTVKDESSGSIVKANDIDAAAMNTEEITKDTETVDRITTPVHDDTGEPSSGNEYVVTNSSTEQSEHKTSDPVTEGKIVENISAL